MRYIYKGLLALTLLLPYSHSFGQNFLGKELNEVVNGLKKLGHEYTVENKDEKNMEIVKHAYDAQGKLVEIKTYYFKRNVSPQICEKEQTMIDFSQENLNIYLRYYKEFGSENTNYVSSYGTPIYKSNDRNISVPYYFTLGKLNLGENGKEDYVLMVDYFLNTSSLIIKTPPKE